MIHLSQIHQFIEKGEVSLRFVATTGEIIEARRCICTSFHSEGKTLNIKFCDSGQVRKVRRVTLLSVNNQEVVL